MSAALRVLGAGPSVTLQDSGRHGYLRFGVTAAGPMDRLAFDTANLAAGVRPGSTAIEISVGGLEISPEGGAVSVAVAGGKFKVTLDGRPLPPAVHARLEPGARLAIRAGEAGSWCYLAVSGHLDVPAVLGSVSTHTRSNLGGFAGRGLAQGDLLRVSDARAAGDAASAIVAPWLERAGDVIRVILGPQDDYFAADQIDAFLAGSWIVSGRADRMGYLLEGPQLTHVKGFNIVSDGIAIGGIQVPGEGRPIVLMADRQPTGGYPKIANVIGPDIGRLAQLRPGDRFRFQAVSVDEAVMVRRQEADALATRPALEPLVRADFSSEFLLGLNLIDGVADARV